jgi:hypothetical protein
MNPTFFVSSPKKEGVVDMAEVVVMAVLVIWAFLSKKIDRFDSSNIIIFYLM